MGRVWTLVSVLAVFGCEAPEDDDGGGAGGGGGNVAADGAGGGSADAAPETDAAVADPDSGEAPQDAGPPPEPDAAVRDPSCEYPGYSGIIEPGWVMPPLFWESAFLEDGTEITFGFDQAFCEPEYADFHTIVIIVGAGWCVACPSYFREVGRIAPALQEAGALLLFVETEEIDYTPSTSANSQHYINRLVGRTPGIRVGDGETRPTARAIYNAPVVEAFPSGFVVRKRDMRIIADQQQARGMLDFVAIAMDPEAYWGRPGYDPQCGPGDEESSEPNDSEEQASALMAGQTISGGVCGADVDYYRVEAAGPWRVDLDFEHAVGDLDVYLIDEQTHGPVRGAGGQPMGSNSQDDGESFEHEGPATIMVLGRRLATAPYDITLTEL